MNRVAFILPYFGSFPNYFNLFLKSCQENRDLCDWILFTDNRTKYPYPFNMHVHYISWEEMRKLFQKKFDFPISLENPYKLCDYRAAYGFIFEPYLRGYEFWGYCDCDLIWGKFSVFLKDTILDCYDKIFNLGHCTIYRNTYKNNRIFFSEIFGKKRYKEVFSNPENVSFDEEYQQSINTIYDLLKIPVFEKSFAANLFTKTTGFCLTKLKETKDGYKVECKRKNFFVWNNGHLVRYVINKKNFTQKEYLYIHFQSRPMNIKFDSVNISEFKMIPNAFERLEINENEISNYNIKQIRTKNFSLHYIRLRSKNLITKVKRHLEKTAKRRG